MPDTYHQQIPHPVLTEAQINIAVLKSELDGVKREMKEMRDTLNEVKSLLTQAKGGWRVMMLLGGGAATLGAALTWVLTNLIHIAPRA